MRKVSLFITMVVAIILFTGGYVAAQQKSPAESQVDKGADFWDKMKGFTDDEADKNKKEEPAPAPKQSPEKVIKKKPEPVSEPEPEQEIVEPVITPAPRPAPKKMIVTEPPVTEKKQAEEPVKSSQFSKDREVMLDEGISNISSQITTSLPSGKTTTVAITDFNDLQGKVTMLGRYIGEELITSLFQSKRVKIVERSQLEKALEELKFNATDLVDPDAAQQLGKVVGAEAIVTGTLSDIGRLIKLNSRIIKVETGEVIGAASAQIIKSMSVEDMMNKVLIAGKGVTKAKKGDTQPAPHTAKETQKAEVQGFLFELLGCDESSQTVTCNLTITNKEKDRELNLGKRYNHDPIDRMFDDAGNEFHASNFKIANKGSRGSGSIGSLLVSRVPVNASIRFEGVATQSNIIALLEINLNGGGFKIQFRDVAINK